MAFQLNVNPVFLILFKLSNGTEDNFSFCRVPLHSDNKISVALNDYTRVQVTER